MSLADSYAAYMLLSESMRNHEALLTAYPSPEQKELDAMVRRDLYRRLRLVETRMAAELEVYLRSLE